MILTHINQIKVRKEQFADKSEMRYSMGIHLDETLNYEHNIKRPIGEMVSRLPIINRRKIELI